MTPLAGALRPGTIDEIITTLRMFDGRVAYVAGGTDLIIAQQGASWPDLVIDITAIEGLDTVKASPDFVRIGAATTMTSLIGDKAIQTDLTALAQAAAKVGSVQIRNRATIGGNIASAMPAGDLLPVLKCLEAQFDIIRRNGSLETLEFDAVVKGRGETCLGNGDLITSVCLPRKNNGRRISAFVKIGPREVLTIAQLGIAANITLGPVSGQVVDARLVAGAVAPKPLRMRKVEAAILDREIDQLLANDFLNMLGQAVDEVIPGRHSQPYKRRAIVGLGLDLLGLLFDRQFDVPTLQAKSS